MRLSFLLCLLFYSLSNNPFYSQETPKFLLQTGHLSTFKGSISADGKFLVTGGLDQRVLIWDLKSQKHFEPLIEHTDIITDIKCDAENLFFYSCGLDKKLIKWDLQKKKAVKILACETEIRRLVVIPNEKKIGAICGDSTIRLFDYDLNERDRFKIKNTFPISINWFKKGTENRLFITCTDSSFATYYTSPLSPATTYKSNHLSFETQISSDFSKVAIPASDGVVYVYGLQPKLSSLFSFPIPIKNTSPDNSYNMDGTFFGGCQFYQDSLLLFANETCGISVFNCGKNMWENSGIYDNDRHFGFATQILLVPGTSQVLTIHWLRAMMVWDLKDFWNTKEHYIMQSEIKRTVDLVSTFALHPSGKKILISTLQSLLEYSLEDGKTKLKCNFNSDVDFPPLYFSDGERLAIVNQSDYRALHIISTSPVKPDTTLKYEQEIYCYAISPVNDELCIIVEGRTILRLRGDNYQTISIDESFRKAGLVILNAYYSKDGKRIAFACKDKNICIYNIEKQKTEHVLKGHDVRPTYLEFSNDGKMLLSRANESKIFVWDLEKGKIKKVLEPSLLPGTSACFDATGQKIITTSGDKILRVFDSKTFSETGRLDTTITIYTNAATTKDNRYLITSLADATLHIYSFPELKYLSSLTSMFLKDEIIAYTNDNYYVGGKYRSKMLSYCQNGNIIPIEQFDLIYNRPDKILESTSYGDTALINQYKTVYQKRLKKYGKTVESVLDTKELPVVSVLNRSEINSITEAPTVLLHISAKDPKKGLSSISVFVNQVPVSGNSGINCFKRKTIDTIVQIPLGLGENYISVKARNADERESFPETLKIKRTTNSVKKNDMYVVCLGVSFYKDKNFNLKYAAKDATDLYNLFYGDTTLYAHMNSLLLTDSMVTRDQLPAIKRFLSNAKTDDVILFYIAGHGVLSTELDYYFATHDLDFKNPELRGITIPELEEILCNVKSFRKLLILDSCHSGELIKDDVKSESTIIPSQGEIAFRGDGKALSQSERNKNSSRLMNAMFSEMTTLSGATILAATSGSDYAMESESLKNGLFTSCLINGLKTMEADLDYNKNIGTDELIKYLRLKVSALSNGMQEPNTRFENEYTNFIIW